MSLGWDDEAPTGYQDADLELMEFEAQAAEAAYEYDLSPEEREALDPFAGLPFGEQQREVDWLETRFESPPEPPDPYDDPWDGNYE